MVANVKAIRWLGKAHPQTSDNDRLKRCKTNFKFNPKPSYCVAYVTGCVFNTKYYVQKKIFMLSANGNERRIKREYK